MEHTIHVLRWRSRLVLWLSLAAAAHIVAGIALALFSGHSVMDSYHRMVARTFGFDAADLAAAQRAQAWWMSLFGATVQCLGVFMLALVRWAGRQRIAEIWLWLAVGLLIWAPQDIALSWRAGITLHVIVDSLALLAMLPPLILLWRWDRAAQ